MCFTRKVEKQHDASSRDNVISRRLSVSHLVHRHHGVVFAIEFAVKLFRLLLLRLAPSRLLRRQVLLCRAQVTHVRLSFTTPTRIYSNGSENKKRRDRRSLAWRAIPKKDHRIRKRSYQHASARGQTSAIHGLRHTNKPRMKTSTRGKKSYAARAHTSATARVQARSSSARFNTTCNTYISN